MPRTREEERQRKAAYRARKREELTEHAPSGESVEDVVRRELHSTLPPVDFVIAVRMAQIMDNRSWVSQHAGASRILRDIVGSVKERSAVGSKLAQLRAAHRVDNPVVPIRPRTAPDGAI